MAEFGWGLSEELLKKAKKDLNEDPDNTKDAILGVREQIITRPDISKYLYISAMLISSLNMVGHHGHDHIVVRFTTVGICCFFAKQAASMQIGWLGIRIICLSGVICLPAGCCFSELALKIQLIIHVGLTSTK